MAQARGAATAAAVWKGREKKKGVSSMAPLYVLVLARARAGASIGLVHAPQGVGDISEGVHSLAHRCMRCVSARPLTGTGGEKCAPPPLPHPLAP